ncbi:MAG: Maf family protein [Magnetospiraceae bacterium]
MASIILASGSSARAALLTGAGVPFEKIPADLDEDQIKQQMVGENPAHIAAKLAEEKARVVARQFPGRYVLGADQMLALGTRLFDKPKTLAEARDALSLLRGQTHVLISAATVVCDDVVVWETTRIARLTMRYFSDDFLEAYLSDGGRELLDSVGAYRLEGDGVQLFDQIDGDYFTILGLPLVPLLDFLRRIAMLPT